MTTPQLEKADQVIESLERDGHRFLDELSGYEESTLISYIAQAITRAENDKLEEAAAIVDEYRTNEASDCGAGQDVAAQNAAAEIRSLKSKVD